MEQITIKNFGPIYNLEMDIKQINIFIGPHASGKTITSQLIYFFRVFYDEVFVSLYLLSKLTNKVLFKK